MNILPSIAVPQYSLIVPTTQKEIKFRPYLVKEEKLLMIAMESQDNDQIERSIIDIIQACVNSDINVSDLTAVDVEYIFLKLRSVSVGEKIELLKGCQECEADNEIVVNLENVEVDNLNVDEDSNIKLDNNLTIKLSRPRVSDTLGNVDEKSETEILIDSVVIAIDKIWYGEDVYNASDIPKSEIKEFVENLSSTQFSSLINYLIESPYVVYRGSFTCKSCGTKNDYEFDGLLDFFI